jgi:hypothetical protein
MAGASSTFHLGPDVTRASLWPAKGDGTDAHVVPGVAVNDLVGWNPDGTHELVVNYVNYTAEAGITFWAPEATATGLPAVEPGDGSAARGQMWTIAGAGEPPHRVARH